MKDEALKIIRDEHRALGAVVHGLLYFARDARDGGEPNFRLLWTMLRYVAEFPQTLHHPKEESCIFDVLARRTHRADNILAQLRGQHEDDLALTATMRRELGDLEGGAGGAAQRFGEAVESFASLTWAHMRVEENELLPIAGQELTDEDWRGISEDFSANGDPRFGPDAAKPFDAMFREILNLAPAPIGLA